MGGALRYRAQGGLKGVNFGRTVGELDSLRSAQVNRTAANVFGDITQDALEGGPSGWRRSSRRRRLPTSSTGTGPKNAADRAELISKLVARREDILRRLAPQLV